MVTKQSQKKITSRKSCCKSIEKKYKMNLLQLNYLREEERKKINGIIKINYVSGFLKRWAGFVAVNAGVLNSSSLVCPMASFSLVGKSISLLFKSFSRFSFQIKAFCQKLLGCAVLHLRTSTIENSVLAKETVSMAHKQTHSLCFIHCYRWQSIFNGLLRLYLHRNSYGCKKMDSSKLLC